MGWRNVVLAVVLLCSVALASFLIFRQQLTSWLVFGVHPEVLEALEHSANDQRSLAELDRTGEATYRERFEAIETLRRRLLVIEHNRATLVRRFELVVLSLIGAMMALAALSYSAHKSRDNARLERLRVALADLGAGRQDVRIDERGRDAIGRVAAMIESTSRIVARDRRRLQALENLSAWQEAARRHAHEMKTPLTAARLELERLRQMAGSLPSEGAADVTELAGSLGQELERLAGFTRRFTSFARLPTPKRARQDLGALAEEFATAFAHAWPNLAVRYEHAAQDGAGPVRSEVEVDREMLRQVLVNLCDNSSLAIKERAAHGQGSLVLRLVPGADMVSLEVADDGPGIADEVRRRLFEPYATTRRVGEGMGLGLAISKKILLDHGGDLEVAKSDAEGTTFRLTFPRAEEG